MYVILLVTIATAKLFYNNVHSGNHQMLWVSRWFGFLHVGRQRLENMAL